MPSYSRNLQLMESKNICRICLRTNRKLKVIPAVLSDYHKELINHIIPLKNLQYCSDCECLLRKTYNFQQKCANAAKILKKWMKTSTKDRTPTNLLHLKLPPISLGKWTSKNNKVFNHTCADSLETLVIKESVSDEPGKAISKELNTPERLTRNATKEENVDSVIHCEKSIKMELDYPFTGESDAPLQNFTIHDKLFMNNYSEDTINVFQNVLIQEYTDNAVINAGVMKRSEKDIIDATRQATNKISSDKVDTQSEVQKTFIEFEIDNTKNYIEYTNITPKLTHEIMPKINEDVSKPTNDSNSKSCISDTEDEDKDLVLQDFNSDDNKYDDINVIDLKNEYPDDASLNSDNDCYDHLYSPPKATKMIHNDPADTAISDEDLDNDHGSHLNKTTNRSDREDFNIDNLISTERNILSKLESMNKTLDSIFENWEVTSLLTDVRIVGKQTKDEVKKITHTFLAERKSLHPGRLKYVKKLSVLAKIGHLSADLDLINEMCVNTVEDYKIGLCAPKERLKAKLKKCGDLKTEDGFKFNKDTIITNLDMISDRLIQRLLNLMHGKTRPSPDAAKILKAIQDTQQFSQYESVFDIEYLTTEKDKLEEFERRKTYECYVKAAFKCETCYQGFKSEGYLVYHKKIHDETQGQFSCRICHVRQNSKEGNRKHMLLHQEVFKCKLCPLVTYYRGSMVNHYEQHKGTVYECEKCGKTYKSKSAFAFHKSRAHPRGAHVCAICGNGFISQVGLHSHVLRKHRGESSVPAGGSGFGCEECALTFLSEEACVRHRRVTHGPLRNTPKNRKNSVSAKPIKDSVMTCPECKAEGRGHTWLVKHFHTEHPALDVTRHAEKKTYLCDICGKGFASKYDLRDHIGLHAGVTFPCATCGKQFESRQKLRQHQLWHGAPRYCCERCGKKFHAPSNLSNHMRMHIGERRFKCSECGKGFLHSCALTKHVRGVHHHERRFRKPRTPRAHVLTH